MIIDGRAIAKKVEGRLRESFAKFIEKNKIPTVSFLSFGEDPATQSFLAIKKKVAERMGVDLKITALPEKVIPEVAEKILISLVESPNDGVVVQLPLPENLSRENFLQLIPKEKDVDCLSPLSLEAFTRGEKAYAPPVALAIAEIFNEEKIDISNKKTAVVGFGNLVGKPIAAWLEHKSADFEVFDLGSDLYRLREFDIVISGVGKSGIITTEMVRESAVLIDAGTSEVGGKLAGDITADAKEKASRYTPVPGGVGPITVVKLFENVLQSIKDRS